MINYHPDNELLSQFVAGELPASLSAAVAMHNELCTKCQQKVLLMTEQAAESMFDVNNFNSLDSVDELNNADNDKVDVTSNMNFDIADMVDQITSSDECDLPYENVPVSINVKGHSYQLPRAIQHMSMSKWNSLGKLSRSRMQLDENEIHTSLLQIEAGGGVPEHTHKGFELTLLLSGEFQDENGCYVPGDFIMCDASHRHTPYTEKGCLCYTVANAPQHFTQGFNKLLNPIGSLIY